MALSRLVGSTHCPKSAESLFCTVVRLHPISQTRATVRATIVSATDTPISNKTTNLVAVLPLLMF